jgi:hypothetical protein
MHLVGWFIWIYEMHGLKTLNLWTHVLTLSRPAGHICITYKESFQVLWETVSHFFSTLPSTLKYPYYVEPVRMHFPAKQPCTNDTVCSAACRLKLHVKFVGCNLKVPRRHRVCSRLPNSMNYRCVERFTIGLHTKFHISSPWGLLIIVMKQIVKEKSLKACYVIWIVQKYDITLT